MANNNALSLDAREVGIKREGERTSMLSKFGEKQSENKPTSTKTRRSDSKKSARAAGLGQRLEPMLG